MPRMKLPTHFRCLVGQGWAICLDYDIAIQEQEQHKLLPVLRRAVNDYLDRVDHLPYDEQQCFLNRSAPWWLRWRYPFAKLVSIPLAYPKPRLSKSERNVA